MSRELVDITIDSSFNTFYYPNFQNKIDSIWRNSVWSPITKRGLVLRAIEAESWYNKGSFNGDVAVQFNTTVNAGGLAYTGSINNKPGCISVACGGKGMPSRDWRGGMNYLNIWRLYGSWAIFHEILGHVLGSKHTTWCGWTLSNGIVGRIDSCVAGEGSCGTIVKGSRNGTMMSYCYNTTQILPFHMGNLPRAQVQDGLNGASRLAGSYLSGVWLRIDSTVKGRYILSTHVKASSNAEKGYLFENGKVIKSYSIGASAVLRRDTFLRKAGSFRYLARIEGNGQNHFSDSILVASKPSGARTITYSGITYIVGSNTAKPENATDLDLTTRWLTSGPATVVYTYPSTVNIREVSLQSGFQGGSPNLTLTLSIDGVDIPLGYVKNVNFVKSINVTGKVFTLTTTGDGGVSRILEIGVK